MKILLATQKPFAKAAVDKMKEIAQGEVELALLENYADRSELLAAVTDADALIVRSDKVTADVVDAAARLKIVARAGAGYDNVDIQACSAKNIVVMNTPGQNSNAVAELAVGMIIYLSRNSFTSGTGSELRGKKLGIHAYGNVGRLVAAIGKGFGMEIHAFDPFVSDETLKNENVTPEKSVRELYAACDIISIHIPANAHTVKSINSEVLGALSDKAIVVNTARKEVIDEDALLAVMQNSRVKYGTDVMPDKHEQFVHFGARYFATLKKIGAETAEANMNAAIAAIRQIIDFFKTGNETFRVNR